MTKTVVSMLFASLALLALGWLPAAKAGDQILQCGDPLPTVVTFQANEEIVFASGLSQQDAMDQMEAIQADLTIAGNFMFNLATGGISCTICPFEGACQRYRTGVGDLVFDLFIEGTEGQSDWDVIIEIQETVMFAVLCTDCLNPAL